MVCFAQEPSVFLTGLDGNSLPLLYVVVSVALTEAEARLPRWLPRKVAGMLVLALASSPHGPLLGWVGLPPGMVAGFQE